MPKYRVKLLSPAWLDLDSISDYHLYTVGSESARSITQKILSALERLEMFPLSCPIAPYRELAERGYRMLVCGKYVCIYEFSGDTVYVHHIAAAAASNNPALFR